MRLVLAVLALLLLMPSAEVSAEGVRCGTHSAHSRRCFFSFYQPCMKKTGNGELCHGQSDDCRSCNDKLFACWKGATAKAQCGDCAKVYDRCMHPVVEKQNRIAKGQLGAKPAKPKKARKAS